MFVVSWAGPLPKYRELLCTVTAYLLFLFPILGWEGAEGDCVGVVTGGGVHSNHMNPKLYWLRVRTTDYPRSARYALCSWLVEREENGAIFSYFRACNSVSPSPKLCSNLIHAREISRV